jgi:hypothetical protein
MRILALVVGLSMVVGPATAGPECAPHARTWASGPDNALSRITLKQLDQLQIIAEDLSTVGEKIGLSVPGLESRVLDDLKRSIPKMRITNDSDSIIYVNAVCIMVGEVAAACNVNVQILRPATIFKDASLELVGHAIVTVWSKDQLLTGPLSGMKSQVYEAVGEQLTQFAADYHQANP